MSFKEYIPIQSINTGSIKWCIRVRVQALWHGITRETKEFRGVNMLLIDDCVRLSNFAISFLLQEFDSLVINILY